MDKVIIDEIIDSHTRKLISTVEAISKQYIQASQSMAENIHNTAAQSVSQSLVKLQKSSFGFSETSKAINESIHNWAERNRSAFEKTAKLLSQAAIQFNEAEKVAVPLLYKYKWFITPNMPIDIMHRIAELDRKKGNHTKAVNNLFVDYFFKNNCQNLEVTVLSWNRNKLFQKRMKIFNDCVQTLKSIQNSKINESNVILPTLISQIDGILTDYLSIKGISGRRTYEDKKSHFKKLKAQVLSDNLDNIFNDIFLNILFQNSSTGKPLEIAFNFNRHKILHGENIKYGRKNNLLRGFLILDYLSKLE